MCISNINICRVNTFRIKCLLRADELQKNLTNQCTSSQIPTPQTIVLIHRDTLTQLGSGFGDLDSGLTKIQVAVAYDDNKS